MKKYLVTFLLIIFTISCSIFKPDKIIMNDDNTISVIHYNGLRDSTVSIYLDAIYYNLEVIGKTKNNGVYVRWGRSNDAIDVKKDWDIIDIGDNIIVKEIFYPKHKVIYYGRSNKNIK